MTSSEGFACQVVFSSGLKLRIRLFAPTQSLTGVACRGQPREGKKAVYPSPNTSTEFNENVFVGDLLLIS